jgi:hypothetical protein
MSQQSDSKIKRFQALLPHLDREYRHLLATFEILKFTTTEGFEHKIVRSQRLPGYNEVGPALLTRCIIIMHRLLHGWKATNPSLLNLVRPLLAGTEENAKIVERLGELYLVWPELVVRWRNRQHPFYMPKPPEQRTVKSVQEQQEEFSQRVEKIRSEWAFLETERKAKLDKPRNKVFAHLDLVQEIFETPQEELERDARGLSGEADIDRGVRYAFGTITSPEPHELWRTLEELVPGIGNCIAEVAYVWQKADLEYELAQRLARRSAAAFWEFERV